MQRRQLLAMLATLPFTATAGGLPALEAEARRRRDAYLAELRRYASEPPPEIFANPADPVIGRADAKRAVLVFTDYNCVYCRKIDPVLEQVSTAADAPARFVLKLQATMAESSVLASAYALQVWRQQPGRFGGVHRALLQGPLPLTTAAIRQIAQQTGTQASLAGADGSAAALNATQQLSRRLQVYATPSMLIGARMISGMTDAATLRQEIVRWPMEV